MQSVIRFKILALAAILIMGSAALSSRAQAADTLTDAITLHNTGVSDDVLIAWAAQQPPVPKTAENFAKLNAAKLSAAVIDALTQKAAPPAPKPAAPAAPQQPAEDMDIRLAGNAAAADLPAPALVANTCTPTVVIDGNTVYNYDPFHTVVYGWPYVYSIYPWSPDYFPYRYDNDWRRRDWTWNDPRDAFRWHNQITPTIPNATTGTAVSNHSPHWPQRPEVTNTQHTQPPVQNRPHFPQREFEPQQAPTIVRTPPANVETHVTSSGVKYVTEAPQSRPATTSVQPQQQTPQYYAPPATQPTTPVWTNGSSVRR